MRLLPLFTEFHNRYPDVEVDLKFSSCGEFTSMLKENQMDIAFYIAKELPSPDLVSAFSLQEPIALLASPGNPLAQQSTVSAADISECLLILTEEDCSYRMRLIKMLEEEGVTPRSILGSGNVQVMKQLAIGGIGITQLPRVAAIDELADGRLVELPWAGPPFDLMTQIVYHKDKWISPVIRAFIGLATDFLQQ